MGSHPQLGSLQICQGREPEFVQRHQSLFSPILFKSGAERIIGVLGMTATFPNLKQYEMACVHRQEIQTIILKCVLITQTGTVIGEGAGARSISQDNGNLNTSIKACVKSALVDVVLRVTGLSNVFMKTHRNTLAKLGDCHKNSVPVMSDCNINSLPGRSVCNSQPEEPLTDKQKHLIKALSGRKGLTAEGLEKAVQRLFNKDLDKLNRVEASSFIQHLNG